MHGKKPALVPERVPGGVAKAMPGVYEVPRRRVDRYFGLR
jgi:hypothetical protein